MTKRVSVEDGFIVMRPFDGEGFEYDFQVPTTLSALHRWVSDLRQKSWVTDVDLEQVIQLTLKANADPGR